MNQLGHSLEGRWLGSDRHEPRWIVTMMESGRLSVAVPAPQPAIGANEIECIAPRLQMTGQVGGHDQPITFEKVSACALNL